MKVANPIRKRRFRKRYILLFLLLMGMISSHYFMTFRTSDKATLAYFKEANQKVDIHYHDFNVSDKRYRIRSVSTVKKHSGKAIIFIHGAPGSGDAFYSYLKNKTLLENYQLITYDRPGYGYSNYGIAENSIEIQAVLLEKLMSFYQLKEVVVVGHSFGGPIAALMPKYSKKIKGVLLLAPALDPAHEKIFDIAYVAKWKTTRWMVPKSWVVAADEKFSHIKELTTLENTWGNIAIPIVHIQGKKDRLVPFANLKFAQERFKAEVFKAITLEDANHFIPWTNEHLVIAQLQYLWKL